MNDEVRSNKPSFKKKKLPKRISETYLLNAGKFYLEKFPASIGQFRTVMLRKIKKSCAAHSDQSFEDCVQKLEDLIQEFKKMGFLNDEAYAKGLTRSLYMRGLSSRRIIAKLQNKNIASPLIAETLSEYDTRDLNTKAALNFIKRKKIGAYGPPDQDLQKSLAALARAGFEYDLSQKILTLTIDEINELKDPLSE